MWSEDKTNKPMSGSLVSLSKEPKSTESLKTVWKEMKE
jgi:hypothetical protein